ncbi:MAG: lipoprotein [Nanoarchaeota archaeon]|nr:lipoprotein [Nanoarchaeota archaeon]
MKKILFLILTLILLTGCTVPKQTLPKTTEETTFCKAPYIEYQKEKCCLDQNNNGICDDDDLIDKEMQIAEKKLNEAPVAEIPEVPETTSLFEEGIPEECPYICGEEYECKPIYNSEGKINKWTCVYIKE